MSDLYVSGTARRRRRDASTLVRRGAVRSWGSTDATLSDAAVRQIAALWTSLRLRPRAPRAGRARALGRLRLLQPVGYLPPGAHPELVEDAVDVDARRANCDSECLGDLPIAVAQSDQLRNLALARREHADLAACIERGLRQARMVRDRGRAPVASSTARSSESKRPSSQALPYARSPSADFAASRLASARVCATSESI